MSLYETRKAICNACPHFREHNGKQMCMATKQGQDIRVKLTVEGVKCPRGRWDRLGTEQARAESLQQVEQRIEQREREQRQTKRMEAVRPKNRAA